MNRHQILEYQATSGLSLDLFLKIFLQRILRSKNTTSKTTFPKGYSSKMKDLSFREQEG